jgi:hypothetical protein
VPLADAGAPPAPTEGPSVSSGALG